MVYAVLSRLGLDVNDLLAAEILALTTGLLTWLVWWLLEPERLIRVAGRLRVRERKPFAEECWFDELDNLILTGKHRHIVALVILFKAMRIRVRKSFLCSPKANLVERRADIECGAVLIHFRGTGTIEVSVAMDKGGPKETLLIPAGGSKLYLGVHRETRGIVTVKGVGSPSEVRYWDERDNFTGHFVVEPRRKSLFSRRRRPTTLVIRGLRSLLIE